MAKECLLNYVGGKTLKNRSGECFDVINPATGEIIYEVEVADQFIREEALKSSLEGFEKWSALSCFERGKILSNAVRLLRSRNEELAKIEVLDTGKPLREAISVDITTGADSIEFFAGSAIGLSGRHQSLGDDFFYTAREPLGVCAGIGAWNYPLQIACWKAGPALAAGNSMIFKPSEETPRGAVKLAEIFTEAGVPDGVFNVIQGDGRVGAWLTQNPQISKVSFTGEVSTGLKVISSAVATFKEVTMELGGKSPLLVFEDADIDQAVTAAMAGNFFTQGEICTNCTRVFVHESIYEEFLDSLKTRIEAEIRPGDPMDPSTNFGALISEKHLANVMRYIEKGKECGARLICGGVKIAPIGASNGFFVAPTVFADCDDDMVIVKEEIFGPVMSILKFSDESEAVKRANGTGFGLAAGVLTGDITRAHRVVKALQAGICWINSYGNSPVEIPVGGYKNSGVGRENGIEALNHYTRIKSVYVGMSPMESAFV